VATRVLAFPEDDEGSASSSGKKRGFLDLSFGAELLDFLEAGPKMRKWYGAPEKGTDVLDLSLKKEIAPNTDDLSVRAAESGSSTERDTVLVLDASGKLGEEVVLQLILKRTKVKALVGDREQACCAFGEYVSCVESSLDDRSSVRRLLEGVKSVVVTGSMGYDGGQRFMEACLASGVGQVVLMSSYAQSDGLLGKIFADREQIRLEDLEREKVVKESGVAFTIIRAGDLKDSSPGLQAKRALEVCRDDKGPGGRVEGMLSRTDFACATVASLDFEPRNLTVELSERVMEDSSVSGTSGSFLVELNSEEDWNLVFE